MFVIKTTQDTETQTRLVHHKGPSDLKIIHLQAKTVLILFNICIH